MKLWCSRSKTPRVCAGSRLIPDSGARRIEAHLLDQLAGEPPQPGNPDASIAASLLDRSGTALATVQRYTTAAERSYFRARRELQQGRSREFRNKANEAQAWLQGELRNSVPPQRPSLQEALHRDFEPHRPPIDPTVAVPVYFPPDSEPNRGPNG